MQRNTGCLQSSAVRVLWYFSIGHGMLYGVHPNIHKPQTLTLMVPSLGSCLADQAPMHGTDLRQYFDRQDARLWVWG